MPDVTYVVAAYNSAETVHASVQSALSQESVTVEVVVVDDASSDRTAEVAAEIDPQRVTVVTLPHNLGPGGARNAGLDRARGTWVGILDSDDALAPGRTRRMIEAARTQDTGAVVDNMELIDSSTGQRTVMFTTPPFRTGSPLDLAAYIDGNVMLDHAMPYAYGYLQPLVRRDVLAEHTIRYDETMPIGEDFGFFAEVLARTGPAAVVPDPGYEYRVRSGSISSRLRIENVRQMQEADRRFAETHRLDDAAEASLRRRGDGLAEILDYLLLVDALKSRSAGSALEIVLRRPIVVKHLSMSIRAKLARVRTNASRLRSA